MLEYGLLELIAQGSGLVELLMISVLVVRQVDHVFLQMKQTAWLFRVFGYREVLALSQNVGAASVRRAKKP